jgi:hypothetical protein
MHWSIRLWFKRSNFARVAADDRTRCACKKFAIEIHYFHLLAKLSHYVVNYAALCGKHKEVTPGQVARVHGIGQCRNTRPLDY